LEPVKEIVGDSRFANSSISIEEDIVRFPSVDYWLESIHVFVNFFVALFNGFRLVGLTQGVFITEDILLPFEPTHRDAFTRRVYKTTSATVSSENTHTHHCFK